MIDTSFAALFLAAASVREAVTAHAAAPLRMGRSGNKRGAPPRASLLRGVFRTPTLPFSRRGSAPSSRPPRQDANLGIAPLVLSQARSEPGDGDRTDDLPAVVA